VRALVTKLLAGYKRWISPLLPVACRYQPTCSEYAQEAVERHGLVYGGLLVVWRLLRCHPLARAGYDPVPGAADGHRSCAG
jgi:putative membrane protein insertion efficiency factor